MGSDNANMNDELQEACKPLLDFLNKYGDPHSTIIVTQANAEFSHGECGVVFDVAD